MSANKATLELRPECGPIGSEIAGIDLSAPLDGDTFNEIEVALWRYAVVVIRDSNLMPAQLAAFSRRFGRPQVNVRAEATNAETPEVFWISNITEDGKPVGSHDAGRYWHSDLCYLETPSKMTLLNAIEVPERDGETFGDTQFASATAAYDALPDDMKARLDGLTAANGYRYMWNKKAREFGLRPVLTEEELQKYPPDAVHPIVRKHPVTDRKCLFVCEGYTHRIVNLPEAESDTLLQELFAHLANPAFHYRHKWRVGDLLMWDNCAVQHKATNDYELPLRRLMQRCTIEGPVLA
ncbi:MAG: TauD/TfdA family dioxygenase [Alphaproteobacteria bacterium]|nr:TauD/TfdA family dioxygenase [Alphaproteobacteria bacterium]